MEKDKVMDHIMIEYDLLFARALLIWEENRKKSFLTCWKRALKENEMIGFYSQGDHKKIKMPKNYERISLLNGGSRVADFVSIQAFSYLYDVLKDNHHQFEGEDKDFFEKIKKEIMVNSKDCQLDADNIVRIIRNSFAHNEDSGIARVEYDPFQYSFTIHFNKMKDTIVLNKKQIMRLLEVFSKNTNVCQSQQYKLYASFLFRLGIDAPIEKLLKMIDVNSGEVLPIDEHQKEALDGIMQRIREEGYVPNLSLQLFYPFKGNAWNNSVKMSVLLVYINDLIKLKEFDRSGFTNRYMAEKYYAFDECTCAMDEVALFMSNVLFILCANNNFELLQECMEGVNNSLNMKRIRNAIIHGTFFHDKKQGFHFYDGKGKTESELGYVGYMSFDEILKLKSNMLKLKFAEYGEGALMTLGTLTNPLPHIRNFEMKE